MINFIKNFKKIQQSFFNAFDVYFDFGTVNTRIALKDRGIVLRQPTIIGLNIKTKEYLFYGDEAKKIIGKTPDFIKIIRPITNGIISDFDAHLSLMEHFFIQSVKIYLSEYKLIKPVLRGIAAVPSSATEIEKKAVEEVLSKINFSTIFLVEKPIANAAGSGINIFSHQPTLIADLGGGLIETAIVSDQGIVTEKILKTAGENFNQTIANYVYLKHGLILGESTCEQVKISLLNFTGEEKIITVRGKSLETGLPKSIRLKSTEIKESLFTNFIQIIDTLKELIEISPPEIVDEIYNFGIILTGGLANIKGIDHLIAKELKMTVKTINNPADATINGLLHLGKNIDLLSKVAVSFL